MSARGWRKVRSQGSRLCADCQRPLQRLSLISHACTALVYSSLVINRYIHTDIEKPRKYIVPLSTPKNEMSILIHMSRTGSFIHIVFIFNFCGRIADLQCCDSFYWTMIPVYFLVQTAPSLPVLCSCKCFCIPALQNFYSGLEFAFPDCVLLWGRNLSHLLSDLLPLLRSARFSRSVVSDSLRPHGLQPSRPPCPSLTPGADSAQVH